MTRDVQAWSGLVALLLGAVCGPGAAREVATTIQSADYEAYGKRWHYELIEVYRSGWRLGSVHGLLGLSESVELTAYLGEGGTRRLINDSIYARQKDGSLKKVECCGLGNFHTVYNIDHQLILDFSQYRDRVTDCFAYGNSDPASERGPQHERPTTGFIGRFNPDRQIFIIDHFFDGGEAARKDFRTLPPGSEGLITYRYRRPLLCNGESSAPRP